MHVALFNAAGICRTHGSSKANPGTLSHAQLQQKPGTVEAGRKICYERVGKLNCAQGVGNYRSGGPIDHIGGRLHFKTLARGTVQHPLKAAPDCFGCVEPDRTVWQLTQAIKARAASGFWVNEGHGGIGQGHRSEREPVEHINRALNLVDFSGDSMKHELALSVGWSRRY